MEHQQAASKANSDDLTLKELIFLIQDYWRELWRNKYWIILIGVIFGILLGVRAYLYPAVYMSKLTFMVNEEESTSTPGALGAVLGQFGLAGGGGGAINLEKIISLSRTRKILLGVLLDSVEVMGENDLLANHFIKHYGFYEKWEDNDDLKEFSFSHNDPTLFTKVENRAIIAIQSRIIGAGKDEDPLCVVSFDEFTGILTINTITEWEDISVALCEGIYERLSDFYIEQAVEQRQRSYDVLAHKVDSIHKELQIKEYELAKFQDRAQAILLQRDNVYSAQLTREVQILEIMYGEVIKNFEAAAFLLQNSTPVFQVVDWPLRPALRIQRSPSKEFVLGLIFGISLGIVYFVGAFIVQNAMEK